MSPLQWLWLSVVSLGALYWLVAAVAAIRTIRAVPVLGEQSPREPARWPKLSIVIPACNEAKTIEPALRSKLAEGYPDLELVVVEDRSTDNTGEIVDRLAAEDPRITALHVQKLPDGWLGKLNAMNEGMKRARGEWLLFSDADVHYTPGALRRAIAYCEEQGLDHMAIFPEIWPSQLLLDIGTAALVRVLYVVGRFWGVQDPKSRAYAGVGAFNLVRRSAMERTPGFEWLKLEVADDMALGQMLKRSGARSVLANGRGQVGLYFYQSFQELARSAEKGIAVFKFKIGLTVTVALAMLVTELAPFLALLPVGPPAARAIGALGTAAALFATVSLGRFMRHPLLPALLVPAGSLLTAVLTVRAVVRAKLSGGITWRGTLYPARALIEGRRIQFP